MQNPPADFMHHIARRGHHRNSMDLLKQPRGKPPKMSKMLSPFKALGKGTQGAFPMCFHHHLSYEELQKVEQESQPRVYDTYNRSCAATGCNGWNCPIESKISIKYIQRDPAGPFVRLLWTSSRAGVYYNPIGGRLTSIDLSDMTRDIRRWRLPLCPHTCTDDPKLLAQLGVEASTRSASNKHALCSPIKCSNCDCNTYFFFSNYRPAAGPGSIICLETRRFIDFADTNGYLPHAQHESWLAMSMGYRTLLKWLWRDFFAQRGVEGYFPAPASLVKLPAGEQDRRAEAELEQLARKSHVEPNAILSVLREENDMA